jgi:AraC-like DNA-binding protein
MSVFNLPHDIFPGQQLEGEEIIIHDYLAAKGSFKGKSILHTNAISMVLSGQKTMHFANKTVKIKDDELHFLSAGNCLASMNLSDKDAFRSLLIFFTDGVLNDFYVKHIQPSRKVSGILNAPQPYVSLKKDEFIRHFISSLLLMLKNGPAISRQMKLLKFEELMLYLLENNPSVVLSFYSGQKSNSLKIRKVVESNITANLTLEELAFLCNLSLSTFKRRFAEVYKTAPNKWLLQRKMEMAARLLDSPDCKPSDVFYKLGYENHSSFTKSFKQVHGITPKAYQNRKLSV